MSKKTLSILLAICMILSCIISTGVAASAQSAEITATAAEDYGLAGSCEDGTILHCFDWTLSQIKAELPNIAKAGFTSVQTSPLQPHDGSYRWYWLYQPTNFTVGNEIGSYNDLKSLCTEADKYGIKIIVDVVANHLAGSNNGSWSGGIDSSLRKSEYFHNQGALPDDSNDRYEITHKNIGMPDLNSEHKDIQNKVFAMLTSLKNAGVDGIRWDAAKHIGLPSEDCAFWSKMATAGLYQYGEILEAPANKSSIAINRPLMAEYAEYINVTDDMYGANLTQSINTGRFPKSAGNWTKEGIPADKIVYWAESHDSYSNDGSAAWSKNIDQNIIDRSYAILGARADSQCLYFSRPSESSFFSIAYGKKGSTHYTSKEVAAVNHFHNAMIGTKEKFSTSAGCYVICRGGGAVIVSPNKSDFDVTAVNSDGLVPGGTYIDEVSGTTWTVTEKNITGHIGPTGIAVIYNGELTETELLVGDADQSGDVSILDATHIQRCLASLAVFKENGEKAADCDFDSSVTIIDATAIQRYLASLVDANSHVGQKIKV